MTTFVLVHGAFHGAWCWQRVAPLLQAAGHTVTAPDLPGHGADRTPLADLSMDVYADRVVQAVNETTGPVTLVGHSMAGVVISLAAERAPERIGRLVYLSAYLLGAETSIADRVREGVQTVAQGGRVTVDGVECLTNDRAVIQAAFYQDATEADIDWVMANLRPEPLVAFKYRLAVTEARFGRVPRDYISCRCDRAITPAVQDAMLAATPCRRVWSMEADHSPFVTAPADLAGILLEGEETTKDVS